MKWTTRQSVGGLCTHVIDEAGNVLFTVYPASATPDTRQHVAKLAAAAPELLETLVSARHYIAHFVNENAGEWDVRQAAIAFLEHAANLCAKMEEK